MDKDILPCPGHHHLKPLIPRWLSFPPLLEDVNRDLRCWVYNYVAHPDSVPRVWRRDQHPVGSSDFWKLDSSLMVLLARMHSLDIFRYTI